MNKLPDLVTACRVQISGNIRLDRTTLACVINHVLQKRFSENCAGLVKNSNHYTVSIEQFSNHISFSKELHTHIRFYDEIVNQLDRSYTGLSFMGFNHIRTGLE